MTEIYLAKNHLLLAAGYGNMEMHSHSASHVLVGLHGKMRVVTNEEEITCRGAILPSGIAFSGYLVFRKLFCAYMQIAEGASITET